MHPDDHMFHILLSYIGRKSFLISLIPATTHQQIMTQSWNSLPWKFKTLPNARYIRKSFNLTVRFNLTIMSTIAYSSVVIDIDGYCKLSYHLTLHLATCLKNLTINLAAIMQLTHKICKQEENKDWLNSATCLNCMEYPFWLFSWRKFASTDLHFENSIAICILWAIIFQ